MPGMNTDMSASDDHLSRLDTAEGKKMYGLESVNRDFPNLNAKRK